MIEKLKQFLPSTVVVVPGSDHSYRKIDNVTVEWASVSDRGKLAEADGNERARMGVAVIR